MSIRTLIISLISIGSTLPAQNEASKWYFGTQAGLDFMTNPPTILTNGVMASQEGCATMSDAAGNLLFYTNGLTVWNSSHAPMANGTGLMGSVSTTQSGVIVKQPGNQNLYFVFTADAMGGPGGLRYSVINMSLAAGSGSVITKNVLLQTPTSEKITAVKHCNGTDVWVVSHDLNSSNFRVFLVTSTGVNPTPVISTVGPVHNDALGYMKASGNGKMLGVCVYTVNNSVELYDFDNVSGLVSNPVVLGTSFTLPYGCEFSPDCKVFYACDAQISNACNIYQWNLCAGSANAIIASQYTVATPVISGAAMQLAPNGKIYVCRYMDSKLSVINDPNVIGAGCNFADGAQSIFPKTCRLGLPNFVTSVFKQKPPAFTYTTSCLSVSFTKPSIPPGCSVSANNYTSHEWLFGDPSSGTANTSTLTNPMHTYATGGSYTVHLVFYGPCTSDTVRSVISTGGPTLSLSGNFSVCAGQQVTYTVSGASTYTWSNGSNTTTFSLTPVNTGTYSVSGTTNSCIGSNVFTVTVLAPPTLSVSGDFSACTGEKRTYTVSGASTYTWDNGSNTTTFSLAPVNTGTYSVSGTTNSCIGSSVFTVAVLGPPPTLSVSGAFSACTGEKRTYTVSGANTYTWSNGSNAATFSITTGSAVNTITYSVNGTAANSCTSNKVFTVTISECAGLPSSTLDENLKLYPNPVHDLLYLETDSNLKAIIYTATGQRVLELACAPGKHAIDLSRFAEGFYSVKISNEKGAKTFRFLKAE